MTRSARPILVTGAAGFIGSTLVDHLLGEGRDVVGLDSFEPFYSRTVKERNLAEALKSPRYQFVELDTRSGDALRGLLEDVRPDVVVDFAARAGVRDSLRDPWIYIDINVRGLQNLLGATAAVGAAFVYASSSSVYGSRTRIPFREDDMHGRPASPYGATKVAAEALINAHHENTELPVRIARLFTVYGPRQRPDLAVHKFAAHMLRGERLPLFARGSVVRDYTFVEDVVAGFQRLIETTEEHLIVNLGGHHPYTNLDLVRALERALGAQAEVEMLPPQVGDVPATYANVERARKVLGWSPRVGLDEGLRRFCDWFLAEESGHAIEAGA